MNSLHEILTTKIWMIEPTVGDVLRRGIMGNMQIRLPVESSHFVLGQVMHRRKSDNIFHSTHLMYEHDAENWDGDDETEEDDSNKYVCVIHVGGPVTRNGDDCSYGSKDHRQMMLNRMSDKNCEGFLFCLDTPGGSSAAIPDYKYAINEARKRGLPVLSLVDGMAASAGMYIAALCDERYYLNPSDRVGSIGTYAAWLSMKDGEKDGDGYTYHEVYDPESYDKNKWYRDAMDGDTKLLVDDLKKHGAEFRADVKAACPNAKEEHLHGKMFNCSEVTGILVDGPKTMNECLLRVEELYKENHKKKDTPSDNGENTGDGGNDNTAVPKTASIYHANDFSLINIANMDKKYVTIASLCGVEELHASDEGVFLNAPLIENFNANMEQNRKAYEAQVAKAKQDGATALDEQKKSYEAKMAELQKQLDEKTAALNDLQGKFDEQAKAIEGHAAELKKKDDVIAERDQTILDKDAQIKQLTNEPGAAPEAGASPSDNGAGVQDEGFTCKVPQYDSSLSPAENKARMEEYNKKLRGEAYGI